jgi:AcrR family transcriptional regulator
MVNEASDRPRLTPKGARTRARIVEEAAALIHERGVAGTTLEDVKVAAEVSGSQMYHYFPDKDALIRAVLAYQADTALHHQRMSALDSLEGLRAWRDMIVAVERGRECRGGCPLGSLAGQLAEIDPRARADAADSFGRWEAAIRDGLRAMQARGHLGAAVNADDLAVAVLAALQGGLLLAQIQRSTKPLEIALDTMVSHIELLTHHGQAARESGS